MGVFDFLKSKKKKEKAVSRIEAENLLDLNDVDLSGAEPPESRYTQEYQDFLAEQERAAQRSEAADAEQTGE